MSRILSHNGLWKTVEKQFSCPAAAPANQNLPQRNRFSGSDTTGCPLDACSGCAGDYEDPDRTAFSPDQEEDEDDEAKYDEEFPAR